MSRKRSKRRPSPEEQERRAQRSLYRNLREGMIVHGDGRDARRLHELLVLLAMDPIAFENLIADLMKKMGMEVATTARSGDGGVDVRGVDPDPFRGGHLIVQAKRYKHTVAPTAVRDLYGTLHDDPQATKGILVTTSRFGPSSHKFVSGKPLQLIDGVKFAGLLKSNDMGDIFDVPTPCASDGDTANAELAGEVERFLLYWDSDTDYDTAVLVCDRNQVLSDGHAVFYNNLSTPDGAVSLLTGYADSTASVVVDFQLLPPEANRLVLLAAVDTESNPSGTMSDFTNPILMLEPNDDRPATFVHLSNGSPSATAMRIGRLDKSDTGDWAFTPAVIGYPDGLRQAFISYGVVIDD